MEDIKQKEEKLLIHIGDLIELKKRKLVHYTDYQFNQGLSTAQKVILDYINPEIMLNLEKKHENPTI